MIIKIIIGVGFLLCILLNTTRNRTSILGFNLDKIISTNISRTILT